MARALPREEVIHVHKLHYGSPLADSPQKPRSISSKLSELFWSNTVKVFAATVVFLIALRWIYSNWFYEQTWVMVDSEENGSSHSRTGSVLWKVVSDVAVALTFGSGISLFTYFITYMDSDHPGVSPPTPLSPRRIKEQSGHMIHLCYGISLVNGILVFIYALWARW